MDYQTSEYSLYEASEKAKTPLWVEPDWDPIIHKIYEVILENIFKEKKNVLLLISVPFDDERAKKTPSDKGIINHFEVFELGEEIENQQVIGYACTWFARTCS